MSVGLDLGGGQFRSLRRQGHRLMARASRAVYAVVLDNPARRALFAEKQVPFAPFGSNLILFGDAAEEWSTKLRVSAIPLCIHGRLQIEDSVIRQVISALIEGLLPTPASRPADCCLTLPAGFDHTPPAAVEFLSQVIRHFGYQPLVTSASLAVALAELTYVGVSGIGIHLGATRSEFSVVRHGAELARFEIPCGLTTRPATPDAALAIDPLTVAQNALREIFATAAFELNRRPEWKSLSTPIALAIGGDAISPARCAELIPLWVQHASWPFAVGMVRVAAEPEWAISRGCLIQAELEHLTAAVRPAA